MPWASEAWLSVRCTCFFLKDVQTGLVWLTKIVTDPFHDVLLYHRAPLYLLRGELIDPMGHDRLEAALAAHDA